MKKLAVTFETLKSKPIQESALEKGIAIYDTGHIDMDPGTENAYRARINHADEPHNASISFSRDGCDLASYTCDCIPYTGHGLICEHIVAAVLAAQGGVAETKITLGKTASVSETVGEANIASAVGSGSLRVFATPMMIALMERATCEVLADALDDGQTSVGTFISVDHTSASPVGAQITATATITSVSGRRIGFHVSASDGTREIGHGDHTRMIIDAEKFMSKINGGA